jgi:hypothetical protein
MVHDPGLAAETERRQQHIEGCASKSGESMKAHQKAAAGT